MSRFAGIGRGRVYGELTMGEAQMLDGLAAQLIELLGDGLPVAAADEDPLSALLELDGPVEIPDDPVLRRLLPDGRPDDPEASAEFRRFTERDLRHKKIGHARAVHETLEQATSELVVEELEDPDAAVVEIELDRADVDNWLRTITDVRLAIAERLEIKSDDDAFWAGLDPEDPRLMVYQVYVWLAVVLESLLASIDTGGPVDTEDPE